MVKSIKNIFVSFVGAVCFTLLVGCKSSTPSVLTFSDLSTELLTFDTDVRPFLSTLEYAHLNNPDLENLTYASSSIKNLSYEMGEAFKGLNSTLSELSKEESSESEVTSTETEITIKKDTLQFFAKLNKTKTDMSVRCVNDTQEYYYELKKVGDGGYFAQIATKNSDTTTYTIYQLKYKGTTGKLNIAYTVNTFVSIYAAEIKDESFPSINEYSFEV